MVQITTYLISIISISKYIPTQKHIYNMHKYIYKENLLTNLFLIKKASELCDVVTEWVAENKLYKKTTNIFLTNKKCENQLKYCS